MKSIIYLILCFAMITMVYSKPEVYYNDFYCQEDSPAKTELLINNNFSENNIEELIENLELSLRESQDKNGITPLRIIRRNGNYAVSNIFLKTQGKPDSKLSFDYDSKKHVLSELIETLNQGVWDVTLKKTYIYNSFGKVSEYHNQKRVDGVWIDSSRIFYTYDFFGNTLSQLYEKWENNSWVSYWKNQYTYGGFGKMLYWEYAVFEDNQWKNSYRYTYEYDKSWNLKGWTYENWMDEQWINDSKLTIDYDYKLNIQTRLYEQWLDSKWIYSNLHTSIYDKKMNLLSSFYENFEDGVWTNVWRFTMNYDSNGQKTGYIYEDWKDGIWVNSLRTSYNYDGDGNLTRRINESFDADNWFFTERESFLFLNGNMIKQSFEIFENGEWVYSNKDLSFKDGNFNNFYLNGCIADIFWTQLITSVEGDNAKLTEVQCSPNPINITTTINYFLDKSGFVKIDIYNSLGEQVGGFLNEYQTAGPHNENLDCSNFSPGLYYCNIASGNVVYRFKLIKI